MRISWVDLLIPSVLTLSATFCGLSLYQEIGLLREVTRGAQNINISGRQRMLSQRSSFLATLINLKKLKNLPDDPEFNDSLELSLNATLETFIASNEQLSSFCSGKTCSKLNRDVTSSLVHLVDGLEAPIPINLFTNANNFLANMELFVQFIEEETKSRIYSLREIVTLLQITGAVVISMITIIYSVLAKRKNKKQQDKIQRMVQYLFHEIRNPLNHVVSGIDYILTTHETVSNDTRTELEQCAIGGVLITSILNDVLTLASLESKNYKIDARPSYVRKVVCESTQIANLTAKASHVTVQTEVDDSIGIYDIDAVKLSQVLMNFITNAVKYCGHGNNVTVGANVLSGGKTKDDINFYISDNGPGISQEMQKVLFERFRTFSRNSGTGIGLYITRVIVEKMGGKINVTSPLYENHGTKFDFTLTLEKRNRMTDVCHEQVEHVPNVKILIADDEEINCRILQRKFMSTDGWDTQVVQSLREVLEKSTTNEYHVIFLDEHFGTEETGSMFIKTLRKHNVKSKIVIASANCSIVDAEVYKKRGADGTIPKPTPQKKELIDFVNNLLTSQV